MKLIDEHKVKQIAELASKGRNLFSFAQLAGDWVYARHLELIALKIQAHIIAAKRGNSKNILVLEAPPRHGKSELVSKRLPAWYLCRWPKSKIVLATYSADFSRVWGRRAREVLAKVPGFGVHVSRKQSASSDWEVERYGGGMATTGIGGPLTGRGADLLIVDDPVKNAEEAESAVVRDSHWDWWQTTASTRIEPGGAAIIIATRWHRDDLIGRVIQHHGAQVERISLPAIAGHSDPLNRTSGEALWPDRWPQDVLLRKRDSMSRAWWEALYQQNPIASGENEFVESWFEDAWFEHWPTNFELKVMSLDPSKGGESKRSDYQAVIKLMIGLDDAIYIQADIKRRPIPQMVADTVDIYREFRPHVFGLECNAWQDLLAPDFAEEFKRQNVLAPEVWKINNQVNKLVRIRRIAGYLSQKRVRFKSSCTDTRLLVDQLIDFPNGQHDDGPDAMEMAIRLAEQLTNGPAQ